MRFSRQFAVFPLLLLLAVTSCGREEKAETSVETEAGLLEKAEKAQLAQRFGIAVETYEQFLKQYPASAQCDKALFMAGFLKAENLGRREEALAHFEMLISEHPESELADDAQFMVESIESGRDVLSTFEAKTSK